MGLLRVEHLDKKFGQHYALSDITFQIDPGEVHALVGENGAGKSTFIKTIAGMYTPDGGSIYWRGSKITIPDPKSARKLGINVVHQDRHLVPSFSGYENLHLGLNYPSRIWGVGIKWSNMKQKAQTIAQELGILLDLNKAASSMSPPEKTMLEIIRAMMLDCQLLILDEPTAALSDQESEQLFSLMQRLTAKGTAILYVSHRLEEIFRISDRITVFRNGKYIRTERTADIHKDQLICWMSDTGDTVLSKEKRKRTVSHQEKLLEIRQLSTDDNRIKEASLFLRQGEVVGIFGLAGSGRTELLEAIYGLTPKKSGQILINSDEAEIDSPRDAIDQGIVLIPEERKLDALVMNMSIRENMTLAVIDKFRRFFQIDSRRERHAVNHWIEAMKVKALGSEQSVGQLSGGNQQKVVFARALFSKPRIYLCDEPTQAVDIMTREEIHRLISEQADNGCGILFVSSDLQEVLDICDRLYLLHEGKIIVEIENKDLTAEKVLRICFSQTRRGERESGRFSEQS